MRLARPGRPSSSNVVPSRLGLSGEHIEQAQDLFGFAAVIFLAFALALARQGAIVLGANENMGARVRNARQQFVDVGLAVADHRRHRRPGEPVARRHRRVEPAKALLLLDGQVLIILGLDFRAPPDRGARKSENHAVGGVDDEGGMREQPDVFAVADLAEIAFALGFRLVIDLGGVLKDQDMAPSRRLVDVRRRRLENFFFRHLGIAKETPRPNRLRQTIRSPTKACMQAIAKARENAIPLFCNR